MLNFLSRSRERRGRAHGPTLAAEGYPELDPHDTAHWVRRIDYGLPSAILSAQDAGVWRPDPADSLDVPVSDHFPVWMDVRVGP